MFKTKGVFNTNSTHDSPSTEANSSSASKEITSILHKNPNLIKVLTKTRHFPILSQINPVHALLPYFFTMS